MLVPWLRAAMKAEYYRRMQARGLAVRLRHVEQANRILDRFWAALEGDPRYARAISANDLRGYENVVREKGMAVRQDLMRDADTTSP
jgi:hypothetical protein